MWVEINRKICSQSCPNFFWIHVIMWDSGEITFKSQLVFKNTIFNTILHLYPCISVDEINPREWMKCTDMHSSHYILLRWLPTAPGDKTVDLEKSSALFPLEGDVVLRVNQTERRRGCCWMEAPCHETVILTTIKLTSIHYWKWLPTLQTHLGECAVIREFVGEGPECLTTTLSTTVRETEI